MRGRLLSCGYPALGVMERSGAPDGVLLRAAPVPELVRQLEGEAETFAIRGYGLEWDVVADLGWFTESFERGAFVDTLDEVRLKIGHDYGRVALGFSPDTLTVREDDRGLYYESDLDMRSPEHRTLAVALERRDVRNASIGFSGMTYEFTEGDDDEVPHYNITKVRRLWEISAVDFPAHESSDMRPRDALVPASALTRTRLYSESLIQFPQGASI